MEFLTTIKTGIAAALFTIGSVFAPAPVQAPIQPDLTIIEAQIEYLNNKVRELSAASIEEDNLGATFVTPETRALFSTTLASKITSSATSMTLTSATDKDGNTLASSTYGFIIDEGTSAEEFVLADCTSTVCTNMTRGISVSTGTTSVAALQFEHRRGASVKITTAPSVIFIMNVLKGRQGIETPIGYVPTLATTSITRSGDFVNKEYVDGLAFSASGFGNASASARGVVEIAQSSEVAAGTPTTGGSGAALVIPSSNATSSYVGGASNRVVVTGSDNKIDPYFIATSSLGLASTSSPTFSGTVTISSGTSNIASSSILSYTATTTAHTGLYTWTKPSNLKYISLEMVGGGGGGGDGGTAGGGAGAGGYCRKIIPADALSATVAVTVGNGGAGGASSGSSGGNSTFGSFGTSNGGSGSSGLAGADGGATTGCDVNVTGGSGTPGVAGYDTNKDMTGSGGASYFGSGARGVSGATDSAGVAASTYGSGGSGSSGTGTGGAGASGIIIVTQYFY